MSRSNPGLTQFYERYWLRHWMVNSLLNRPVMRSYRWYENVRLSDQPCCWQSSKPGWGFVMDTHAVGLRYVGKVIPEKAEFAREAAEHCYGWYDNNHGESVLRTGEGLIWGEVYLLVGRKGMVRYVGGWKAGGCDGVTIDFGTVFEERGAYSPPDDIPNTDRTAAKKAARHADAMAADIAEQEREYRLKEEQEEEEG
jgi:hypothetical protein